MGKCPPSPPRLEPLHQMKVSLDNPTQLLSPLTNFLFTHAKEIYIFKPKCQAELMPESQDSSLLSLLTVPQEAGPTDSGISQVLFPQLGPEPR